MALAPHYLLLLAALLPGQKPDPLADSLKKKLEALPGRTAFLFAELTDKGPVPLYGVRAEERFAIGSSFKLYILGTLIAEVNAGRRRAEEIMNLRQDLIGPPFSEMAEWPTGSPATLHTLALKMISISDNTATDHLHYLLGRQRIEEQMAVMGHRQPAWNLPLLSTREMTMLRDRKAKRAEAYSKMSEAERRRLLDTEIAKLHDFAKLDFDTAAYDLVEWYATPLDMAKTLDWIRRHTGSDQPAHSLRAILTVETKLKFDPKVWTYVGFKGGSEDQLLCGNWLLQHKNGKWYAFHLYWNNPAAKVDPKQLAVVLQGIFDAVAGEVK